MPTNKCRCQLKDQLLNWGNGKVSALSLSLPRGLTYKQMQMPTKRSAFKLGEWQGLSAQPQPPQRTNLQTNADAN